MSGIAITKEHLRVPIICIWTCKWCGREIRRQVIAERIKRHSRDLPTYIHKKDYHEYCWTIAIEVQIEQESEDRNETHRR